MLMGQLKEGAMRQKKFILSCAGSFLLVLASASYGADTPAEGTVNPTPEVAANPPAEAASNPPQVAAEPPAGTRMNSAATEQSPQMEKTAMGTSMAVVNDPGRVYLIRENPFFGLHIDKALGHAREAEIAGSLG